MADENTYAIAAILCIHTLSACMLRTIGQYIYAFYLHIYSFPANGPQSSNNTLSSLSLLDTVNYTKEQCAKDTTIKPNAAAQAWAQQQAADLFFWIHVWNSGPLIIMAYIIGLYIPKLGTRFVLILTMVGNAAHICIWLTIIYFHLPQYWWYIAAFIVGLSGSDSVLSFALNLYITNSTVESKRSSRYVLFHAMAIAVAAVGNLTVGYYITWRGFTDLFWAALAMQGLSILVVVRCFKSTPSVNNTLSITVEPSSFLSSSIGTTTKSSHFFDVLTVFSFKHRSRKKSISLLLTLFAYIFYSFTSSCFTTILWIVLNTPFCWTSQTIGIYQAVHAIILAVLSFLGMKVLTRLGSSDALICVLSHFSFCAYCLSLALARQNWQLYVALFPSAFATYQSSLTLSMMSKWLKPHEINKAFTCVTEAHIILWNLGSSFFNWFYARTVVNHNNFTMLLAAGLGVVPLILNIVILTVQPKMSDEELASSLESTMTLESDSVRPGFEEAVCLMTPSRSPNRSRSNSDEANNDEDETTSRDNLVVV